MDDVSSQAAPVPLEEEEVTLLAPDGTQVTGTYDLITGAAYLISPRRDEDGQLEWDHLGETQVFWNGQRQIEHKGERVFISDDGGLYLESELRLSSEPPLPETEPKISGLSPVQSLDAGLEEALSLLERLNDWARQMGGFEAPVWGDVDAFLNPPHGPLVTITFHPQAWVNDTAVGVDPEGPVTFQVRLSEIQAYMERKDIAALKDDSDETDGLRTEFSAAPAWIRDWSGPFYITTDVEDVLEQSAPRASDGDPAP